MEVCLGVVIGHCLTLETGTHLMQLKVSYGSIMWMCSCLEGVKDGCLGEEVWCIVNFERFCRLAISH